MSDDVLSAFETDPESNRLREENTRLKRLLDTPWHSHPAAFALPAS